LQNEKCAVIFDGKLLFILVAVAAADLRVTAGKEMAGNFRKKTLPHTKCGSGKLLFAGRWQEASGVRDRRRTRRISGDCVKARGAAGFCGLDRAKRFSFFCGVRRAVTV